MKCRPVFAALLVLAGVAPPVWADDPSGPVPLLMQKPTAANHWVKTGPHVMVVGADASFYDAYPKSPDPDTTQPYVMWAGTPYQHLMAPVK